MNKKILFLILFILVIIILKNFVLYDKYKMPKGAEIEVKKDTIDVYSEDIYLFDLIKTSNIKVLTENSLIDTNSIGNKSITITYKCGKSLKKYLYDVKFNIVDTESPIFIKAPSTSKSFYVDEASKKDIEKIKDKITFGDNYDINPQIKAEYDIDFSKIGTYKITFEISDSSNNITSKDMEIIIKERPKKDITEIIEENEVEIIEEEKEEESFIPFEEHVEKYKNSKTMIGIDVSKWQGEIDFDKIKDAGCEFVIMRIGVMKDKDSELVKDSTFDNNYKNAKKSGLKVGIYVYSEANNVETAISNAEFIINELNGDKLDFPIAFDWESWTYFNSMEMNLHMLNKMYDAFSNKLKEAGYDSMLYASEYYLNNVWMDLKDYTLWVAKYSSKNPEITNGNKHILWQNSNTGRIDGIDSDVDLDIYYKN